MKLNVDDTGGNHRAEKPADANSSDQNYFRREGSSEKDWKCEDPKFQSGVT